MKHTLKHLFLFSFSVVVLAACKNSTKPVDGGSDTPATDTTLQEPTVIQHNFPDKPENTTRDTAFALEGKKYGVKINKRTIDTSFVFFQKKVMGKIVKDVYADFEYFITPTGPTYKGGEVKVTKHTFKDEFNDDFFKFAVLYSIDFLGFNETNKEFEFSFLINKPDTDNTFKIYFFINNKGEIHHEVEDLAS